ncbi:MAG TPA: MBG domain-containing protein, partial [Planctomycetota bacterium]
AAASVDQSFTVAQAAQTITFGVLANKTYGDAPFTVSATGGASGNPVTFAIASGPATINGNEVTITGAGLVTVTVSQAGTANYSAAADVDQSFIVAQATPTITFGALSGKTYGDAPFTVSATGGASGNPVTFEVSGPATINGNEVTITGAGLVTVTASQAGNANYSAAADVDQSFIVAQATQTITFGALSGKTYGDAPFTVNATGGASGNPVTFAIASGPATATGTNGSTITITGAGLVTVRASQAGTANYSAAADVDQPFTVAQAAQTITFGALSGKTYGDTPFTVSATGGASGNPVTFEVSGPATINGNEVTITGAGLVTVTASQAGNANYSAAADVDQSFIVAQATQTITFGTLSGKTYGDAPFTVSATGGASGNPVTFAIASGPATATGTNGSTITITGAGLVTVRASQAGFANYSAAPYVDQSFNVAKASAMVTLSGLSQTYDGSAKSATVTTTPSGLAVVLKYNDLPTAPKDLGSYPVTATIADANYQGSADGVLIIAAPNSAPAIDSPPTISPSQPKAGESVAFSTSASDSNNDTLTYTWDFGDNTTGMGAGVSHIYSAAGSYTVTLTVSDGKTSTSSSVNAYVAAAQSGGGGPVLPPSQDSDGDGFSDQIETALGSNPNSASTTPGGAAKPTASGKLSVSRLSIKLNFSKPQGNDSIGLSGLLLIPEGFSISGQTAIVDIGGVVKAFTLDPKGKSPKGNDSLAVGVKSGKTGTSLQIAKFAVKLSKGSYAVALADDGLINATTSARVSVPVTVIFNGDVLEKAVTQAYKATRDKAGATK